MKRQSLVLLVIPLVLGFTFGDWGSMRPGQQRVILPAGEVHEGWYFATGSQVTILGTVNGDAYIAGGVVDIPGTINGQLVVAGGQVNVSGTVTDRIFGGGGTVRITGKTGKSIIAAGGTVVIGKDATVGDNLLAAGGGIQIDGTVDREARVAGGDVEVTGAVKGNLDVQADRFRTFKGSFIGGNLSVGTGDTTKIFVEPGTVVGAIHIDFRKGEAPTYILGMRTVSFWFQVIFAMTLFATALALAFLLPGHLTSPGSMLMNKPGQSVVWGFIGLIMTPVIALILCITLIGIPLGLFLFLLYLWFLYTSQMVLGIFVGAKIFGMDGKRGWSLFGVVALGLLIVQVLMLIPYVRMLLVLAGLILGVGALMLATKALLVTGRTSEQRV